ncbi:acetylglutamate kinase [Streptococcus sp. DD12]|uniref:acetylglutamate kinase n=1 Tax=Streptococcus sp. DD12 TaxID=1777880 RepID=UPI000796F1ED|nr:acetylglutamate kinase [Streptococcus sp. DD12]KXT75836.1 Acetylglutamate kinase [Streptococcus sp. DD12]
MAEVIVIKIGGRASQQLTPAFLEQVQAWHAANKQLVLVHGGGFAITEALQQAGVNSKKVDGQRVTEKEQLPLIESALLDKVGVSIKKTLRQAGLPVIQLGSDLEQVVAASFLDQERYGYVGKVDKIERAWLDHLLDLGNIPLLASLGYSANGQLLNINADYLATAVAVALQAEELILMTDVPGVLLDGQVVAKLTSQDLDHLKTSGQITGGMIPKLESACQTAAAGVGQVRISDQLTGGTIIQKG